MATTTLAQALYNFQIEYTNAKANKSKRKLEVLEPKWQEINNWWDVYFQASKQAIAIAGIVDVLGGVIDTSTLPEVSGGVNRRDGVVSVSPGAQKITFDAPFSTLNYTLNIITYDSNGVATLHTRGVKELDGFNITITYAGTLEYNAIQLSS